MSRTQPLPSRSSELPKLCPFKCCSSVLPGQLPRTVSPLLPAATRQCVHVIHQQIAISCPQHTRLCGFSYCPIVVDYVYNCHCLCLLDCELFDDRCHVGDFPVPRAVPDTCYLLMFIE